MQTQIAVVNNQYSFPSAFVRYFQERADISYEIFDFRDLKNANFQEGGFHGVILTGTDESPLYRPNLYEEEMRLIRLANCPVLGVCGGYQVMALAFGGAIDLLPNAIYGRTLVRRSRAHPLLSGLDDVFVAFSKHRFIVRTLPDDFEAILYSECDNHLYGVAHRNRPLFGVQFHPERKNQGQTVLDNFISIVSASRLNRFDSFVRESHKELA
jgi:anthranilate/para-aminobenzoate synthase component II